MRMGRVGARSGRLPGRTGAARKFSTRRWSREPFPAPESVQEVSLQTPIRRRRSSARNQRVRRRWSSWRASAARLADSTTGSAVKRLRRTLKTLRQKSKMPWPHPIAAQMAPSRTYAASRKRSGQLPQPGRGRPARGWAWMSIPLSSGITTEFRFGKLARQRAGV
jgi:hypothetical protein